MLASSFDSGDQDMLVPTHASSDGEFCFIGWIIECSPSATTHAVMRKAPAPSNSNIFAICRDGSGLDRPLVGKVDRRDLHSCPKICSPQGGHSTHSHLGLRVEYTEGVIARIASIPVKELVDGHLPALLSLIGSESVLETLSHVLEVLVHFAAPVFQVVATVFLGETL